MDKKNLLKLALSAIVIVILTIVLKRKFKKNNTMSSVNEKPSNFTPATEQDIINALNYIKDKYGEEVAKWVEKIYRLETNHFKSTAFKNTNTAGIVWNSNLKHRDKWCIYYKPKYSPDGKFMGNAIVPEGTSGAKKICYAVFPTVKEGMEFLAVYLNRYGKDNIENAVARWNAGTNTEKGKIYVEKVRKIQNKIV